MRYNPKLCHDDDKTLSGYQTCQDIKGTKQSMENHVCPCQAVTSTGLFLETFVYLPFNHLIWPVGQRVVQITVFFN